MCLVPAFGHPPGPDPDLVPFVREFYPSRTQSHHGCSALKGSQESRREVRDTPMIAITGDDEKVLSSLIRKQSTRRALRCFENTRLGVRHEIDDWADDFDADNVLLITGYPGVGKHQQNVKRDFSDFPALSRVSERAKST